MCVCAKHQYKIEKAVQSGSPRSLGSVPPSVCVSVCIIITRSDVHGPEQPSQAFMGRFNNDHHTYTHVCVTARLCVMAALPPSGLLLDALRPFQIVLPPFGGEGVGRKPGKEGPKHKTRRRGGKNIRFSGNGFALQSVPAAKHSVKKKYSSDVGRVNLDNTLPRLCLDLHAPDTQRYETPGRVETRRPSPVLPPLAVVKARPCCLCACTTYYLIVGKEPICHTHREREREISDS